MHPPTENSLEGSGEQREVERRKDEFIPVLLLAHELRNLLAPIRYAIAAMEKPETTPAQQTQALGVLRRQSTQMSRLLEDLLDVSRFARGELEIRKSGAELGVIIGTAIEAARPLLDARQHSLFVELPTNAVRIWVDPIRLIQVFSNLFINAAKYTDIGGRIEVRATQESESIVVSVRDTGIGITRELIPRIFELFAQDKNSRAHSENGLGIGLALVHGILSLHGGTIEARSEGPGLGSEFVVRFPIGAEQQELPAFQEAVISPTRIGLRVLVVDDNKDVADTSSLLIRLLGHQVHVAYTGRDGIEAAGSLQPHVILTDIGLPDIDGNEFARAIRSNPWGNPIVLVAITGWGDEERKRQSLSAGFDHYLTKPIDPKTLESLLASVTAAFH
jgi:CheY-like chemotaxis protein